MGFFKNLFTWWEGASTGTAFYNWRHGGKVGEDSLGNVYMQTRDGGRRWVMYKGSNDVSRVPPEWYAWLTRQIDDVPDKALPPPPRLGCCAAEAGSTPSLPLEKPIRASPADFDRTTALRQSLA